jgi:hypothetical protein
MARCGEVGTRGVRIAASRKRYGETCAHLQSTELGSCHAGNTQAGEFMTKMYDMCKKFQKV